MKKYLIITSMFLTLPAMAQQQPPTTPPRAITFTDQELEYQVRLNMLACKSIGLDDGGQICDVAKYLNNRYAQSKTPPVVPPMPKDEPKTKSEPAKPAK